jgi:hypothetical protein
MATQKTDALEQAILTTYLQGGTWVGSSIEVALFLTLPAEDGTGGVEVSGVNYARQGFPFDISNIDGNNDFYVSHSGDILWDAAGDNWGTIVGIGLYDITNAIFLYYGTLPASVAITTGLRAYFAPGTIVVTEQ